MGENRLVWVSQWDQIHKYSAQNLLGCNPHLCRREKLSRLHQTDQDRSRRDDRQVKNKPPVTELRTSHWVSPLLCVCGSICSESGRAVIATSCTMSDLPTKLVNFSHSLSHKHNTRTHSLLWRRDWQWWNERKKERMNEWFVYKEKLRRKFNYSVI